MPKVNTEFVHGVELTQSDLDRLKQGQTISVTLEDGSTLNLSGPGESSSNSDGNEIVEQARQGASAEEIAEDRDDVTEDDVAQLVEQAKQESAGNSGLIEKNPDRPDNVEQV